MPPDTSPDVDLDRDAGQPLYSQLRDGLAKWLAARPDGERVPSERKLADMMNVNRRTLHRAVEELEQRGQLVREGRRLFVRHLESSADLVPHAFVEQAANTNRDTSTLTIAVYENLPWQQACWSKIAAGYNARHQGSQMQVNWVPMSVNTDARYLQYLAENQCDLVLAPTGTLASLGRSGAIQPLPESLQAELQDPAYILQDLGSHSPATFIYGAPVHMCIWTCLVNEEYVTRPPTSGPMSAMELATWMESQAQHLPPDAYLISTPGEFQNVIAHPIVPLHRADLRHLLALQADVMQRLGSVKDRVHDLLASPGNANANESARDFAEGRSAYFIGPSYYVLGLLKSSRFPWHMLQMTPPAGYHRGMSATAIGIATGCQDPATARQAVQYLLSTEAQAEIARHAVNCPIRRDAIPVLSDYLNPRGSDALARLVASYRLKSPLSDEFESYVRHRLWADLARAALKGDAAKEQAVNAAVETCIRHSPHFVIAD